MARIAPDPSTLPAPAGPAGAQGSLNKRLLLAIVLTATSMQAIDTAAANVALPSIRRDLHAMGGALVLVSSAYTLAYGCSLITGAALGARFGYRRLFLLGMTIFTVSSALCSLAPSPAFLVACRFTQGLGSGCMAPQTFSVIQAVFQGPARTRAMSVYGIVVGVASVFGPPAAGLILGVNGLGIGWRMIFLVNVPIGIAVLVGGWRLLRVPQIRATRGFDVAGALCFTGGLALLVYPLAIGRQDGWPTWSVAMLIASPVILAGAIGQQFLRQRRGRDPLVELRLLRVPSLRMGLLLTIGFFAGTSPYFFIQPLYLQVGLGHSPLAAGLTAVPFSFTCAIGSRWAGPLSARFGRSLLTVGALGMVVQNGLLYAVAGTGRPGLWEISLPLAFGGLAYGVFFASCYSLTLRDVPVGSASTASGLLPTVQQVAGSVGTAVVGTVFFASLGTAGAIAGPSRVGYATGFRHGLAIEATLQLATALLTLRMPRRSQIERTAGMRPGRGGARPVGAGQRDETDIASA